MMKGTKSIRFDVSVEQHKPIRVLAAENGGTICGVARVLLDRLFAEMERRVLAPEDRVHATRV
jgi:hypothetical protein